MRRSKISNKKLCIWFSAIRNDKSFGDDVYTDKINIDETEMDQNNLWKNTVKFYNKSRTKMLENKDKKRYLWRWIRSLWRSRINA